MHNSSTDAKKSRNEKRVALLAQHGLTIGDVLSAAKFMQLSNLVADPSFDEAVSVAHQAKIEYPGLSPEEIFEAGMVLMDTGWHDEATVKDAYDMARRINAHVKIGQSALLDPAHKLFVPRCDDAAVDDAKKFLSEHDKKRHH